MQVKECNFNECEEVGQSRMILDVEYPVCTKQTHKCLGKVSGLKHFHAIDIQLVYLFL